MITSEITTVHIITYKYLYMKTLITTLIAIVSFLYVADAHTTPYNSDWCDTMFTSLWFQEVPGSIQKEC